MTRFVLLPALFALSLAGCSQPKPVYVDGAYVRLSPNPDNPSAGYLTIHGGSIPVTLRAIETDAAVRLEMHESMTHDGMASMAPIDTVDVPAGSKVEFKPGGRHIMLWQVNQQAIAAGKVEFKLTFSNGDRLLVDAVIQGPGGEPVGAGTPAPTAGADDAHTEVH
ncbi:MAG: copper chaperone PCu(A)C [Sphingobium sp.]|nr:copper chaperone PCu(A)C [Sphingobium sp.]